MAQFTITGERNGKRVRVTWRDGKLTGNDPATLAVVRQIARSLEGTIQGLPGSVSTTANHLSSPYSACAIIRSVFPGKVTQDRPLPEIALPPGAIA